MLRRLRETGPVVLVPLAWAFATAAHLHVLGQRAVLVGHLVMDALLVSFAVLSWNDMTDQPVLRAWLAVITAGVAITLAGTYAVWVGDAPTLARAAVFGWMAAPALALAYTGRVLPRGRVYSLGGLLSGAGAAALVAAPAVDARLTLLALALAGVGQTAGIVAAVVQY